MFGWLIEWLCIGIINYINILYGQPISVLALRHLYWSVFVDKSLDFD